MREHTILVLGGYQFAIQCLQFQLVIPIDLFLKQQHPIYVVELLDAVGKLDAKVLQ